MKRNTTTLFLQSANATTPVPFENGVPDFSQFSEPTLSVLTKAWTDFVESGESLEVVPDPELIVIVPQPNWNGLYQALLGSAVYQHLVPVGFQYYQVDSALNKVIASIQYGISEAGSSSTVAYNAFQSAINLMFYVLNDLVNQPLSVEQLAEVREALDNNNFNSIVL